ncbi:MAG: winged helix-turn-helix domain-containing protein [Tepidiformaceae bacterium]
MDGRHFLSVVVVAPREAETAPFIRALHAAGFAVLQREADPTVNALVAAGDVDLVLCWCAAGPRPLAPFANSGVGLIAVLRDPLPGMFSACLESGADACLDAAADPELIVAQARAILRRRSPASSPALDAELGILQIGDLRVDSNRCEVERAGEYIPLTASEFRIVEYMARNAGKVLPPHEILNAVTQEYDYLPREALDVFKVYVRRIRRKLEAAETDPAYIVTVRGIGYRLEGGAARFRADGSHTQTA